MLNFNGRLIAATLILLIFVFALIQQLRADPWEYGTCMTRPARRHKRNGTVQYVTLKDGCDPLWVDFNSFWWKDFVPGE